MKTTGTATDLKMMFEGILGSRSGEAMDGMEMKGEDRFRESLIKNLKYQRQLIDKQQHMLETLKVAQESDVTSSCDHLSGHNLYDSWPSNQPQRLVPGHYGTINRRRDVTMLDGAVSTQLNKPISVILEKRGAFDGFSADPVRWILTY